MNVACALNVISNKKLTLNSFIKFCYLRVGQVTLVVLWRQERLVHARNHENSFRHFQFYVKSTGTRKSLGRSKSCTNSSAIDWAFLMQMPSTTCRFRRRNLFIWSLRAASAANDVSQKSWAKASPKLDGFKCKNGRHASPLSVVIQFNWKVKNLNWNCKHFIYIEIF